MKGNAPSNNIRTGQTVYLIVSCVRIREAVVRRCGLGAYTVQFTDTKGAICIPGSRLYASREEAEAHVRQRHPIPPQLDRTFGYWHNVPRWMT